MGVLALPKERETNPLQDRSAAVTSGQNTLSGCDWNACPDKIGIAVRMIPECATGWMPFRADAQACTNGGRHRLICHR